MRIAQFLLRFSITILLVNMCLGKIGNSTQKRRNPAGNPNYPPELAPPKYYHYSVLHLGAQTTEPHNVAWFYSLSDVEVHRMFKNKLEEQRGHTTMGVWSAWDNWTSCSRSCGGGITKQIRHCVNKPIPPKKLRLFKHRRRQNFKKITNHCVGLYKRIRLCNTQECPVNVDFRLEQCVVFNQRPFKGKFYDWLPYHDAVEECALNCLAVGGGFYATLNNSVVDGTPCIHPLTFTGRLATLGIDGVCVEGKCKSVGLDGIIGGPSLLDDPVVSTGGAVSGECAACLRGQCRSISGLYTRPDLPPGYSLVAQIPQGACRLMIQQLKHTNNILGLRNSNGSYILNGEWKFSHSKTVEGAGTVFTYRKQDTASVETITAPGPLSNPIDIVIYYQQPNPGIKYGYSIPTGASPVPPFVPSGRHMYRHHEAPVDEAPTSDIGILDTNRYDTDGNTVNQQQHHHHHQHLDSGSGSGSRDYHQHPNIVGVQKDQSVGAHPHRRGGRIGRRRFLWKVTGAGPCSKPCGGGTQTPIYTCIREVTQTPVPERRCAHLEKLATPPLHCNMHSCGDNAADQNEAEQRLNPLSQKSAVTPQGHWSGRWEPCSVSCGQGVQIYKVHCIQEIGVAGRTITLSDIDCPPPKPAENRRICAMPSCETDTNRDSEDASDNELPQHPEERLKKTWPPYADWETGPWSSCSVSCGTGQRIRTVACHKSADCRTDTRPSHAEYCEMGPCPTTASIPGHMLNTHWLVTEWSTCSEQCGTGTQHRRGYCARPPCGGTDTTPETSRQCSSERACAGQWFAGPWSTCSDPCTGLSIQTREVYCIGKVRNGHAHYQPRITQDMTCSVFERPPTERPCVGDNGSKTGATGYCPVQWFQGEWGECENCEYSGSGNQRRDIRCIRPTDGGSNDLIGGQPASGCKIDEQPLLKRPCACNVHNHAHMQPVQMATPMPPYNRAHNYGTSKPTVSAVKALIQDQPVDSGCVDKIRNCYLAVQARLCQYPYYAAHCCTSCKRAPQDQD